MLEQSLVTEQVCCVEILQQSLQIIKVLKYKYKQGLPDGYVLSDI